MTEVCWLLIPDVANPRNTVDLEPELDTKNLTDDLIIHIITQTIRLSSCGTI